MKKLIEYEDSLNYLSDNNYLSVGDFLYTHTDKEVIAVSVESMTVKKDRSIECTVMIPSMLSHHKFVDLEIEITVKKSNSDEYFVGTKWGLKGVYFFYLNKEDAEAARKKQLKWKLESRRDSIDKGIENLEKEINAMKENREEERAKILKMLEELDV